MLKNCAKVYNWSHEEMLHMQKRVFFRYYGYWLIEQIQQEEDREAEARKEDLRQRMEANKNWKTL